MKYGSESAERSNSQHAIVIDIKDAKKIDKQNSKNIVSEVLDSGADTLKHTETDR